MPKFPVLARLGGRHFQAPISISRFFDQINRPFDQVLLEYAQLLIEVSQPFFLKAVFTL